MDPVDALTEQAIAAVRHALGEDQDERATVGCPLCILVDPCLHDPLSLQEPTQALARLTVPVRGIEPRRRPYLLTLPDTLAHERAVNASLRTAVQEHLGLHDAEQGSPRSVCAWLRLRGGTAPPVPHSLADLLAATPTCGPRPAIPRAPPSSATGTRASPSICPPAWGRSGLGPWRRWACRTGGCWARRAACIGGAQCSSPGEPLAAIHPAGSNSTAGSGSHCRRQAGAAGSPSCCPPGRCRVCPRPVPSTTRCAAPWGMGCTKTPTSSRSCAVPAPFIPSSTGTRGWQRSWPRCLHRG